MNICLVSANDVMEHFAFPGNIDFAADDQGEQRRQRPTTRDRGTGDWNISGIMIGVTRWKTHIY